MTDKCRVETNALADAAGAITAEKPKLVRTRVEVTGSRLPTNALGRVAQSGPAARAHADAMKTVGDQLGTADGELTKLAKFLQDWKQTYEKAANNATECLINIRKLRPTKPGEPAPR